MNYWKNILFLFLAFLAVVGVGNALGFMITNGASIVAIIGEIIAVIPAVMLAVEMFKKDVESPKE